MISLEAEILEIIERACNIKSFRFRRPKGVGFKAGQFFSLTLDIGGSQKSKYFSFSSSPTEEGYFEFTKRLTGSEFSRRLGTLKPGDKVKLKMPLGCFTYEGGRKKIAFLSGGIGVTPARSIIKYAIDKSLDADIALLYGNRTSRDIAFKDDFDAMQAQSPALKVFYLVEEPDTDAQCDTGAAEKEPIIKGLITEDIISKALPDYRERVFYVSGPPAMVEAMKNMLSKLDIPAKQIMSENFTGY